MRRSLILIIALALTLAVSAQQDTAFWFAVPNLTPNHSTAAQRICLAATERTALVTITQPANPSFAPLQYTLPPYGFKVFDISGIFRTLTTGPVNTVVDRGLHISATEPITCYYESVGDNSEVYTLKGTNALGTDFLIAAQCIYGNNGGYGNAFNGFEIVATEDSTVVEITPSYPLQGGIRADTTITIVLNCGQSYCCWSSSLGGDGHLGGTRIRSNKPIAVNSSDDSVTPSGAGCADLMGDQIVPIDLLGTKYVAIRNSSPYEYIFIYPTEDSTIVQINAERPDTLRLGQKKAYYLAEPATLIESDKAVAVYQMTALSCELGGTILPQIECSGSSRTTCLRPSTSSMIITIVVNRNYINDFTFNDSTNYLTASDFHPLPYDTTIAYCIKDVSGRISVGSVMTVTNSRGNFHLGVLNATPSGNCSYGFFTDYNRHSFIRITLNPARFCEGDTVRFAYNAPNISYLALHGPGDFVIDAPPFIIPNFSSAHVGKYVLSGIDTSACFSYSFDSIDLTIAYPTHDDIHADFCQGSFYRFRRKSYDRPGIYHDSLLTVEGCDSTTTLYLKELPTSASDTVAFHCGEFRWYGKRIATTSTPTHRLYNRYGCDSIITMRFTRLYPPELSLDVSASCATGFYTLTANTSAPLIQWMNVSGTPLALYNYGARTIAQRPAETSTYRLTADYNPPYSCPSHIDTTLVTIQPVDAQLSLDHTYLSWDQREMTCVDKSFGNDRRRWLINGVEHSTDAIYTYHATNENPSLLFTLIASNVNCADTATQRIPVYCEALYVPNTFTPDRIDNRRFKAEGVGITDFHLYIYDRKGLLVFESDDINKSWDGTHAGTPCPMAGYAYIIYYKTFSMPKGLMTKRGVVTLVR